MQGDREAHHVSERRRARLQHRRHGGSGGVPRSGRRATLVIGGTLAKNSAVNSWTLFIINYAVRDLTLSHT